MPDEVKMTDEEMVDAVEFELLLLHDEQTGYRRTHSRSDMQRIDALRAVAARLSELSQGSVPREVATALAFFKSVIQCGEPWTAECQTAYDAALAAYENKGGGDG